MGLDEEYLPPPPSEKIAADVDVHCYFGNVGNGAFSKRELQESSRNIPVALCV